MDPAFEEKALIGKLAASWHLNVPERRRLPGGQARASLLLDAIEDELRRGGWYPRDGRPDDDFTGGLIELTPQGRCRIHWKTRVSLAGYEPSGVTEYDSPRAAAAALVGSLFGAEIDGIPINWQA